MYLPKVIAYNAKDETAAKRYAKIADSMELKGGNTNEKVKALIAYLRKMNTDLNIPQCIKNYSASCLAGMAITNAFLGIVHSIAHKTGAIFED